MKSSILRCITGILCILMIAQGVYGESVTVSRDMPDAANISSEVTVNLKLDVVGGETSGIIVTEKIPESLSASSVSNEGSFDADTREIKWILYGENVKTQTLSYIITTPPEPGNYTFSGTYTTLEEGVGQITGDEKISVEEKGPAGEVKIVEEVKEKEGYDMKLIIGIIAAVVVIVIIFILIKKKKK